MRATTLLRAFAVAIAASTPAAAAEVVELKLTAQGPEQLPYLYPDLAGEIVNVSSESVLFPKNSFRVGLFLEAESEGAFPPDTLIKTIKDEGGWIECRPMVVSQPPAVGRIDWEEIAPGKKLDIELPWNKCLALMNRPGQFRVKARVTAVVHESDDLAAVLPPRALRGVHESNVVELRIKQPTGVDAEAVAWAKGSPLKPEILKAFPTSEYTAYFLWSKVGHLKGSDPVKTRSLIDRGLYPGPNSVPDPTVPGNWRSVDSVGMAGWQVEWGQRILREHPSFLYRDQVMVGVALAQMSLGRTDDALRSLRVVAQGDGMAASWSREFLSAQRE